MNRLFRFFRRRPTGALYSEDGALKWRGPSGTVTVIIPSGWGD